MSTFDMDKIQQGTQDFIQTLLTLDEQSDITAEEERAQRTAIRKKVLADHMRIHHMFIGAGLIREPLILGHMETYPDGLFVTMMREVIDALVRTGSYTKDMLKQSYGLRD